MGNAAEANSTKGLLPTPLTVTYLPNAPRHFVGMAVAKRPAAAKACPASAVLSSCSVASQEEAFIG